MNYEETSDHEINMAVTCIVRSLENWSVSASNTSFYHCGSDGNGFYEVECIDFCGDASQAWPIIVENSIEIEWVSKTHCVAVHHLSDEELISSGIFRKENALTAAMFCFLKMKDAENA